jgi:uncharacterized protein YjiS (DUF1127 family)
MPAIKAIRFSDYLHLPTWKSENSGVSVMSKRHVFGFLRAAWRRHRQRQQIAHLDGVLLKDIGVSFAEAEAEANKPFWRY